MATNNLGLEYPVGSDPFQPHTDIQALADSFRSRLIIPVANTTARDALEAAYPPSAALPLVVFRADATAGQELEYTTDGTTWHALMSSPDAAWQAPTLTNSWANFGSPYESAGFRIEGSRVFLKGMVKSGTLATIFTLPSGYRPAADCRFSQIAGSGVANLTVTSAGAVNPVAYLSGGSNSSVSLDGISFPLA